MNTTTAIIAIELTAIALAALRSVGAIVGRLETHGINMPTDTRPQIDQLMYVFQEAQDAFRQELGY